MQFDPSQAPQPLIPPLQKARWQLADAGADEVSGLPSPGQLQWQDVDGPWPVAALLKPMGRLPEDAASERLDARDWWYRASWTSDSNSSPEDWLLDCEGLATRASIWCNGTLVLESDNMFRAHRLAIGHLLRPGENELVMVFRSLDQSLTRRQPRPAWRTPMVSHQQLRWWRTSLLGRTPGWSPPWPIIGPWRGISLQPPPAVALDDVNLRIDTRLLDGQGQGAIALQGQLRLAPGQQCDALSLSLVRLDGEDSEPRTWPLPLTDTLTLDARIDVGPVALWWPHTHGAQPRYRLQCSAHVRGAEAPGQTQAVLVWARDIGFRHLELDSRDGNFCLHVNGEPIHVRGVCWTPPDPCNPGLTAASRHEDALKRWRDAGMNMVRVCGSMVYEGEAFFDACDRLGLLVWQDLMFSNMDYPTDAAFVDNARQEVSQHMLSWQGRPSLAVVCGNSEGGQQAAMSGAPRSAWHPALFHEVLAADSQQLCPDVPYWPSSTHGGAYPHHNAEGTTSYYGVGAYLLGLGDARQTGLRFATECLAFANVPEPACIDAMPGGAGLKVHHPQWKARSPRDLGGAGWDFEDVRDHYLATLFELDPMRLRYSDHDRYLTLSRVVTGEVMADAMATWRRAESRCHGALIWWGRDLWPGAGWGVVDSDGRPKAAWHLLKRPLQPVAVWLADDATDGMSVQLFNDTACERPMTLVFEAWRHGRTLVARHERAITMTPRQAQSMSLVNLCDGFVDWGWAHRFGPVQAETLRVALFDAAGELSSESHVFVGGRCLPMQAELGLQAVVVSQDLDGFVLELSTQAVAQWVHFDVAGHVPADAYFHLVPGQARKVRFDVCTVAPLRHRLPTLTGWVKAVNAHATSSFTVNLLQTP